METILGIQTEARQRAEAGETIQLMDPVATPSTPITTNPSAPQYTSSGSKITNNPLTESSGQKVLNVPSGFLGAAPVSSPIIGKDGEVVNRNSQSSHGTDFGDEMDLIDWGGMLYGTSGGVKQKNAESDGDAGLGAPAQHTAELPLESIILGFGTRNFGKHQKTITRRWLYFQIFGWVLLVSK